MASAARGVLTSLDGVEGATLRSWPDARSAHAAFLRRRVGRLCAGGLSQCRLRSNGLMKCGTR